jgi:hypothetical protein
MKMGVVTVAESIVCAGNSDLLFKEPICLSSVSKNAAGELSPKDSDKQKCKEVKCETLKTLHDLKLSLKTHACDSPTGKLFDGTLTVPGLAHAFESASGLRRGVHSGSFQWQGKAGVVTGTLSGITNAGIFRAPPFGNYEQCATKGVMIGRLCGVIEKAKDKQLVGCEVIAVYRLKFKPSETGGGGKVAGTIEGDIVCSC